MWLHQLVGLCNLLIAATLPLRSAFHLHKLCSWCDGWPVLQACAKLDRQAAQACGCLMIQRRGDSPSGGDIVCEGRAGSDLTRQPKVGNLHRVLVHQQVFCTCMQTSSLAPQPCAAHLKHCDLAATPSHNPRYIREQPAAEMCSKATSFSLEEERKKTSEPQTGHLKYAACGQKWSNRQSLVPHAACSASRCE